VSTNNQNDQETIAVLAGLVTELRGALERTTDAAKSYRSDILGCSGDNPNPRNESWMEGISYAPKWEGRDSSIEAGDAALSLPLPTAAANVAAWREKAELLDWAISKAQDPNIEAKNFIRSIYYAMLLGQWLGDDYGDALSALRAARGVK